MKRLYSRNGNTGLLSGGRLALLVIAVVVAALLILRFVFPDALTAVARPLWGVGNVLTAAVGTVTFESEEALRKDRDRLQAELTARTNEYYALEAKAGDIARLGDITGRTAAGVLARPPMSPYDTLVVSLTTNVPEGAQAYGLGGVPIGTVARVEATSAHISLYSTSGRVTHGWAGEGRVPVELVGAGGGAFRVSLAKDAAVTVGEQVYVPGPGALPVGTVARIDTDPSSPTATLFVKPLTNPFSLTWVSIDN